MSEDKVVSLRGAPQALPGKPVPEVIKLLRDMLAQAETGDIAAVGMAIVSERGWTQTAYVIGENAPHWNDLIAAASRLKHRLAVIDLERELVSKSTIELSGSADRLVIIEVTDGADAISTSIQLIELTGDMSDSESLMFALNAVAGRAKMAAEACGCNACQAVIRVCTATLAAYAAETGAPEGERLN